MEAHRDHATEDRRRWMAVLAKAPAGAIAPLWESLSGKPDWTPLRPPETGMVMVRARAGGTGQRFNMGEMTVTRCMVRLDNGISGYACIAGRDHAHAELAAVVDAAMQDQERREAVKRTVIEPLAAAQSAMRRDTSAKVAATKVDFFTMVRGE